ncbi:S-layer homology domain-containing protein [Alkaliphilus sp. B6464]|uniref:S-layer homology domain-containing protein n=1 Tax=Alkaliphilus sp. B6464 TaxID=2731219 RepID=UPI001BAA0D76|nr:S-layer homology domain-containing protein [Alkaliphilus sp. B6464]QUH19074.1 S-layer homology domain-containing protein [Alkaliphilus sp. B6464]
MKKLSALILSGIILTSGLMPSVAEASTSTNAIMNEVIDKVMEKKANGNSTYYDLMIKYKDEIDKETLGFLYDTMLTSRQKTQIEERYGNVAEELNNLSEADIAKLKRKIDAVAPDSEEQGSVGGGGSSSPVTPPKEEKTTDVEVEKPIIEVSFKDISSLWVEAQEAINFMASRGVLQGKEEGRFAPQDPITRAEFAKAIVSLLELENDTTILDESFKDVTKDKWYYEYVQIAFKYGIIEGRNSTTFAPNDLITREEMSVMISRTMKAMKESEILLPLQAKEMLQNYGDHSKVADWAELDVALVVKNKIIQGKDGEYLAPKDNATRAEAVVILKRLFDLLNN